MELFGLKTEKKLNWAPSLIFAIFGRFYSNLKTNVTIYVSMMRAKSKKFKHVSLQAMRKDEDIPSARASLIPQRVGE